jgi:hypothetical protein
MTKQYDYEYITDYAESVKSIHNIISRGVPFLINIIIKVIEDKFIINNDAIKINNEKVFKYISEHTYFSKEAIETFNKIYLYNDECRYRIQGYKKLLNVLKSIDVSDCFSEDDFYRNGKVEINYDK